MDVYLHLIRRATVLLMFLRSSAACGPGRTASANTHVGRGVRAAKVEIVRLGASGGRKSEREVKDVEIIPALVG